MYVIRIMIYNKNKLNLIHQEPIIVKIYLFFISCLTGRFNIREVPALRPLGVSFISCGEAHSAVLTKVPTSPAFMQTATVLSDCCIDRITPPNNELSQ